MIQEAVAAAYNKIQAWISSLSVFKKLVDLIVYIIDTFLLFSYSAKKCAQGN